MKRKDQKSEHSMFSNVFYMLGIMFRVSPMLVIGEIGVHILRNLPMRLIPVLGLRYIVDTVENGEDPVRIVIAVGVIIALMVLDGVLGALFFQMFAHRQREKLTLGVQRKLYDKAVSLDMASYDDPKYYADFILALETGADNINRLLINVRNYVGEIVSFVTLASVILAIDPLCLLIILVFVGAFIPVGRYTGKLMMERREKITEKHRIGDYFARIFYLPDHAAELRMNGIVPLLQRRFGLAARDIYETHRHYVRRTDGLNLAQSLTVDVFGMFFVISAVIGYRVIVRGSMSTGDFVAAFNGSVQIEQTLFFLTVWAVRMFTERSKMIEKYRTFMKCGVRITDGGHTAECGEAQEITLENVSFAYPGAGKKALDGVDLTIRPHEKLALVGYNGAGKTTLTNLLLRLYDPTQGRILIGGRDVRDETVPSHRDRFSAVFQDFQIFGATVGENVALSPDYDAERVWDALRHAGFDKELPDGLDTILLREFSDDGMMLSGGQQQKIAIARAFYKQCPYIILDEPSANLDPVSEYELNLAMAEAAGDKTVIFISHRLSTTRHADRIAMMEQGRIVEIGTHEELMAMNGKYAYMFRLQAEKYTAE